MEKIIMIFWLLIFILVIVLYLRKESLNSAQEVRPLLEKLFETLQKISISNIEFVYESKSLFTTSIKIMHISKQRRKKIGWISIYKENNIDITYAQKDETLFLIGEILRKNEYEVIIKEYKEPPYFTH